MPQSMNRTGTTGISQILLEPGGLQRIQLAWRLARDPRVAPIAKMLLPLLVLLYVVSPLDLVPDFLLGLGQVDDLSVVALALALTVRILPRLAPSAVVAEHVAAIRGTNDHAAPTERVRPPERSVLDAEFRVR